jgi:hypothetical protein
VSTYYLRNTTERPSLLKRVISAVLPLALKRHLLYIKHYRRIGNFRNPKLFSEKMQWRIMNDRREILRHTCDKRASKRIALEIAAETGVELLAPQELVWSSDAEVFISKLRELYAKGELPEKWVMKPNHSSGRALAVEGVPDWELLKEAAHAWLAPSRFTGLHWIWSYAVAECGLIAEEFVSPLPPLEWQLWVIDGNIQFTVVQQRIGDQPHRALFDASWAPIASWYNPNETFLQVTAPPPNWRSIRRTALALSRGFDLIRIDLFEDQSGVLWFGELTAYPHEGLMRDMPGAGAFDNSAGKLWELPSVARKIATRNHR